MRTLPKSASALLRLAWNTMFFHPAILFPFALLALTHVLILEIIFFAPRYPLSLFFGPIIQKMEGAAFLHYPQNYYLLSKWFNSAQFFTFAFLSCFFIGAAVLIIGQINSGKEIKLKEVFKTTASKYIHLLVLFVIILLLLHLFSAGYGMVLRRAQQIRSTAGMFFYLKQLVFVAAPLVQLIFSFILGTLFAFVVPLIMLDKRKILAALRFNFQKYWRSFGIIFLAISLSGLLYLPLLLAKSYLWSQPGFWPPEALGLIILISIFLATLIDAWQYTAVTIYYLGKKEGAQ